MLKTFFFRVCHCLSIFIIISLFIFFYATFKFIIYSPMDYKLNEIFCDIPAIIEGAIVYTREWENFNGTGVELESFLGGIIVLN